MLFEPTREISQGKVHRATAYERVAREATNVKGAAVILMDLEIFKANNESSKRTTSSVNYVSFSRDSICSFSD